LFGPYWAALVSTLGIGGYLASKLDLDRPAAVIVLAVIAAPASLALSQIGSLGAVIAAQTALALVLAIIAIHAGRLLHDGVPSTIRAGVSSGVGTFSWMLFLPFSLVFGWFAREHGVQPAGWFLTAAAVLVGLLLVASVARRRREAFSVPAGPAADAFACKELVELVTDYLDGVLPPDRRDEFQTHLAGCDGCVEYLRQLEITVRALHDANLQLGPQPQAFTDSASRFATTPTIERNHAARGQHRDRPRRCRGDRLHSRASVRSRGRSGASHRPHRGGPQSGRPAHPARRRNSPRRPTRRARPPGGGPARRRVADSAGGIDVCFNATSNDHLQGAPLVDSNSTTSCGRSQSR
jgi:Putative zinc-finger